MFLILGSPEYSNSIHIWSPKISNQAAGMPASGRHGRKERMDRRNSKLKKHVKERREKRHSKEEAAEEKREEERETHIYTHIPENGTLEAPFSRHINAFWCPGLPFGLSGRPWESRAQTSVFFIGFGLHFVAKGCPREAWRHQQAPKDRRSGPRRGLKAHKSLKN